MRLYQIKLWVVLLLSVGMIQSCSSDEGLVETTENLAGRKGDRGGNGNGNDNNNNNDNLSSDISISWMELFLELERYADGMRPNATARALAYINLAAYETAAPFSREYESNSDRLNGFRLDRNRNDRIDVELALNETYKIVMDHFILNIPQDKREKIDLLYEELEFSISQYFSNRLIRDSQEWGEYVAEEIIAYSQTDKEAEEQILDPQPHSYVPPTGDGFWTFSAEPERALFPYWGSVRTFVVAPDQTTTVPPIEYSEDPNSPYFQQMMEAYTSNNTARDEDNEDLWIAEFWSDDVVDITFSPPSRQVAIANQLILENEFDLNEALYLQLKLGFALNDAAVSTWKYKYEHMVMRPNVYIHEFIDDQFQTNLFRLVPWPNPTFPGYPSGHSCFASAAGGVFIDFFGNYVNFTDHCHEGRTEFRSDPRTYQTIEDMAAENAYSRIPLGVHIRMDCDEGLRLGYEISDRINKLDLTRRVN